MSYGLGGLSDELWSRCFKVQTMAWVVWGMSYGLDGSGYELCSRFSSARNCTFYLPNNIFLKKYGRCVTHLGLVDLNS